MGGVLNRVKILGGGRGRITQSQKPTKVNMKFCIQNDKEKAKKSKTQQLRKSQESLLAFAEYFKKVN